jgi:hypothetical protein
MVPGSLHPMLCHGPQLDCGMAQGYDERARVQLPTARGHGDTPRHVQLLRCSVFSQKCFVPTICAGPHSMQWSALSSMYEPSRAARLRTVRDRRIFVFLGVHGNVAGGDFDEKPVICLHLEPANAQALRLVRVLCHWHLQVLQHPSSYSHIASPSSHASERVSVGKRGASFA